MGSREKKATEARDRAADLRDEAAEERDRAAGARDEAAAERDVHAREREQESRENRRSEADRAVDRQAREDRATAEEDRRGAAADRDESRAFLTRLRFYETAIIADRRAAAEDRRAAAEDRRAAAHDRELAAWARQQTAVEAAQMTAAELQRLTKPPPPHGEHTGPAPDEPELRTEWRQSETAAVESARRAAELADEVAQTEARVAASLRTLAAHGDSNDSSRREALADAAISGMRAASERGDRLRTLAERANDDLVKATLRTLVTQASTACAGLSEIEHAIAAAVESLADRGDLAAAADHRREAEKARVAARFASGRGAELSGLERLTRRRASGHTDDEQPAP